MGGLADGMHHRGEGASAWHRHAYVAHTQARSLKPLRVCGGHPLQHRNDEMFFVSWSCGSAVVRVETAEVRRKDCYEFPDCLFMVEDV